MPNTMEAKRLWAKMMQLERMRPSANEDKASFFKNKEKEMKLLRAAYDKAVGLNSSDPKTSQAIAQKRVFRSITGQKHDGPETSDTL